MICGFTGGVSVKNLLPIERGSLGGWPFSINEFGLRIIKNQFAGADMAGHVNVPIFEEGMEYEAVVYPEQKYKFAISPLSDATVDMFLAKADIHESSSISVEYSDGAFKALSKSKWKNKNQYRRKRRREV